MAMLLPPGVAPWMTPEGRQRELENSGLPEKIAWLANLLIPDPTVPYAFGASRIVNRAAEIPAQAVGTAVRSMGRDAMQALRALIRRGDLQPTNLTSDWLRGAPGSFKASFRPPQGATEAPIINVRPGWSVEGDLKERLAHEFDHLKEWVKWKFMGPTEVDVRKRTLGELHPVSMPQPAQTLREGLAEAAAGRTRLRDRLPFISEEAIDELLRIRRNQERLMRGMGR